MASSSRRLDIEIWQILILITTVLSIASSLMWFSNLQPRSLEEEFVFLDRSKNTLYNLKQKFDADQAQRPQLPRLVLNQKCYTDVQNYKLPEDFYKSSIYSLTDLQKKVATIRIDSEAKLDKYKINSGYQDLTESLDRYALEYKMYLEKEKLFVDKTMAIQIKASQLCSGPVDQVESKLDEIDKELEDLTNADPVYNTWADGVRTWRNDTLDLVRLLQSGNFSLEQLQQSLLKFRDGYVQIFTIKFDQDKAMEKVRQMQKEIQTRFQEVEKWQTQLVASNKKLRSKMVIITSDENNSQ